MSSSLKNIEQGADTLVEQPGSTYTENDDGDLSAVRVFQGRRADLASAPIIGSGHPVYSNLYLASRKITDVKNNVIRVTCNYVGYDDSIPPGGGSEKKFSYPGSAGQADIKTHPRFHLFAGDPFVDTGAAALVDTTAAGYDPTIYKEDPYGNGALWKIVHDGANSKFTFLGFVFLKTGKERFFGLKTYVTHSAQVVETYNDDDPPPWALRGTVINTIPGANADPDVVNWLIADVSGQQIGVGSNAYHSITITYLASGNAKGWEDSIVYPVKL